MKWSLHALRISPFLAIVVYINWTISEAIQVTEGQGVEVTLSGEAVGVYANPIAIGVVCAETIATDVEPGTSASIACFVRLVAVIDLHELLPHVSPFCVYIAFPGTDFNFAAGTKLHFTEVETLRSFSSDQVEIPIINDDIAEPCESFICTLQGGAVDSVQGVEPNRVTIEICDDDREQRHTYACVYS